MSGKSLEKAKKEQLETKRLTKAEAESERVALHTEHGEMLAGRGKFMLRCHRVGVLKLHTYFGCKTEEEFIKKEFPNQKLSFYIYREAQRIAGAFLKDAKALPEFKDKPHEAEEFAEQTISSLYKTFENNSEYVSEAARIKVIGPNTAGTKDNIKELTHIYRDAENHDDFIKGIRKEFTVRNPERVAGAKKRTDRGGPAVTPATQGSKVGLNARVDSIKFTAVAQMFDAVAKEAGIQKTYADMNSDDIGEFLYIIAMRVKALFPRSLKTQKDRQEAAAVHAKAIVKALNGTDLDEAQVDSFMSGISAEIDRVAAEA